MAWAETEITGIPLAAHNADKPLLLGHHALRDTYHNASSGGKWTQTGSLADADDTATGYPITRAYDGFAHSSLVTKPASAQVTWYLCFDLSAAPATFSSLFLCMPGVYGSGNLAIQIADNAGFTTRLADVVGFDDTATYGPQTGRVADRMAHAELCTTATGPSLFENVSYLRLKVEAAAGTLQPSVSELWLGYGRQMVAWPDLPYDGLAEVSEQDGYDRAACGLSVPVDRYRGALRRSIELSLTPVTGSTAADYWWDDTAGQAHDFVVIETPGSGATGALMACDADAAVFDPVVEGPNRRVLIAPMIECSPLRSQD